MDLHPQHEKVPYSLFQAALCHERRARGADRDQTPTRDALVFLDQLLSSHPHSDYATVAEAHWRDLRLLLAQQVRLIAAFYMQRGRVGERGGSLAHAAQRISRASASTPRLFTSSPCATRR